MNLDFKIWRTDQIACNLRKPEEVGMNFSPPRTWDAVLLFGFQPLCIGQGFVIKFIPKRPHSRPVSVTLTTPKVDRNWAVHIPFTECIQDCTDTCISQSIYFFFLSLEPPHHLLLTLPWRKLANSRCLRWLSTDINKGTEQDGSLQDAT